MTRTSTPGGSALARYEHERRRASARARERDALAMAALAALPLLTFLLIRAGRSRLEAVGIAAFVVVLLVGWRRGARAADAERAGAWRAGARGEIATAAVLDAAVARDGVVVHDLHLPGRRENVDHVLVDRRGVVLVETKQWAGGSVVVGRHVRVGWARRDEVLDQVARLRRAVERVTGADVGAFVCVHGPRVRAAWFRRRPILHGIRFGTPDDLARWLVRRRRALSSHEVAEIAASLRRTAGGLDARPARARAWPPSGADWRRARVDS